jgi:hypothetical protein
MSRAWGAGAKWAEKGDVVMFASFYPAFVVIALSSFAIVLLGVSLQDAMRGR